MENQRPGQYNQSRESQPYRIGTPSGSLSISERDTNVPSPRKRSPEKIGAPSVESRQYTTVVGRGNAIATKGHPPYAENPLDLTIGLHFSEDNNVVAWSKPGHETSMQVEKMRRIFDANRSVEVPAWMVLSTCHTYSDRVMDIVQPTPILFLAVYLDNPKDWLQVHDLLVYLRNTTVTEAFLPIRYYLDRDVDLSDQSPGKASSTKRTVQTSTSMHSVQASLRLPPAVLHSLPSVISSPVVNTPYTLKKRYDSIDPPTVYSDRSRELPRKVMMRQTWKNLLHEPGHSLMGASTSLKDGEVVGTAGAVVACFDIAKDDYIRDDDGIKKAFLLTNHHVARVSDPNRNDLVSIDDAKKLPASESIFTHLGRVDRERPWWCIAGRVRDAKKRLEAILAKQFPPLNSEEFAKMSEEEQKHTREQLHIGHHLSIQFEKDIDFLLDEQNKPSERELGTLFLSSGRDIKNYSTEISPGFTLQSRLCNVVKMEYALIAVNSEWRSHCHNVLSENFQFPDDKYPAEFDEYRAHRTITKLGEPLPKAVVMKVGRTSGVTFGMIMKHRQLVKIRRNKIDEASSEIYITPIDSGIFASTGDSGAAIVDQDSALVGLMFSGTPGAPDPKIARGIAPTPTKTKSDAKKPVTPSKPPQHAENPSEDIAENFRPINMISIQVIKADLVKTFGLRMELYTQDDSAQAPPASLKVVATPRAKQQSAQTAYMTPESPGSEDEDMALYSWYGEAQTFTILDEELKQFESADARMIAEMKAMQDLFDETEGEPEAKVRKLGYE